MNFVFVFCKNMLHEINSIFDLINSLRAGHKKNLIINFEKSPNTYAIPQCILYDIIDCSTWIIGPKCRSLAYLFAGWTNKPINFEHFNTCNIRDFSYMFYGTDVTSGVNILNFNAGEKFDYMLCGCIYFNEELNLYLPNATSINSLLLCNVSLKYSVYIHAPKVEYVAGFGCVGGTTNMNVTFKLPACEKAILTISTDDKYPALRNDARKFKFIDMENCKHL